MTTYPKKSLDVTLKDIGNTHPLSAQCIRDHIAALEAEAAQAQVLADEAVSRNLTDREKARERALEEAKAAVRREAEAVGAKGLFLAATNGYIAAIDALKSKPARETKPRREHEYGEEARVEFGSFVAACVRPGCQAFRVKNRKRTHTSFRQHPDAEPTSSPGPCEVEP